MATALVGRQPIFDTNLDVFGYELLFRSGEQNAAAIGDGNTATTNVILNSFTDIGLETVVGEKRAFINLTRDLLLHHDLSCLPPEQVVLEVLEDIQPDTEVLAAVKELRDNGYTMALDDFVYKESLEPLIELAEIVKIEFPETPPEQLPRHITRMRQLGVRKILAEKVETQAEFQLCRDTGCDLFQGYFFCKPQVLSARKVQCNVAAVVRLMTELQDPEITAQNVEVVIQTDANLSYKLLRFVNSANAATSQKIESIQHATALMGISRVRSLAAMLLLSSLDEDKPQELINVAMVRAKMCELIADTLGHERPERYYTLGLLSVMDAMLDLPMDEVVAMLPLSDEMNDALSKHDGDLGGVLKRVVTYEVDYGPHCDTSGVASAYFEALRWIRECGQSVP